MLLAAEESDGRGSPLEKVRFITCVRYLEVEAGRMLVPLSITRDWLSKKRERTWRSECRWLALALPCLRKLTREVEVLTGFVGCINFGVLRKGKR